MRLPDHIAQSVPLSLNLTPSSFFRIVGFRGRASLRRFQRYNLRELSMEVVALIPARYGSTRFPGKPLALLRGKPMIQHVYEQTCLVRGLARVIVATDDDRIASVIRAVGGEVAMTRADHPTGTDRLAEVAERLSVDIIVNVQGDLPFFPPAMVEDAVTALTQAPSAVMSTVKTPIYEVAEWQNINVVKVVTDRKGYALYFSRSPIPYERSPESRVQSPESAGTPNPENDSWVSAYWSVRVSTGLSLYLYEVATDTTGTNGTA